MNFRYYCLIVLGDISGVKEDIRKISEERISFLEHNGLIITTFYSSFSVGEINDLLLGNKKNFIVFEMLNGMYGANLNDKEKNEKLFGGVNDFNNTVQKEMNDKLISAIMDGILPNVVGKVSNPLNEKDIFTKVKNMSESDKVDKLDYLFDKGLENLTEYDKKYFEILTKNV